MSVNSRYAQVLQAGLDGRKYLIHSHDRVEIDSTKEVVAGMIHVDDIKIREINEAVLSAYSPTNQPVIAKGSSIDEVLQQIKVHADGQLMWIGMAEFDGDRYVMMQGA